jgi:hypothetical protein
MEMMYVLHNTTSGRWNVNPHVAGGSCMNEDLKCSSIK